MPFPLVDSEREWTINCACGNTGNPASFGGHVELALCEAVQFEIQMTHGYTYTRMCPCCAANSSFVMRTNDIFRAISLYSSQFLFIYSHDEIQERFTD